ncbi:MAG: GNAT family N-acetyltransferase [Rhizobiales bacterium]|nr:GNAT family N-acetyltransferase [Hyphomicrobiales bacterium]
MTAKPASWRLMQPADLPAVGVLAAAIHPDYPEEDAVFVERLRLYPQGCRVFERDGKIAAYVVSHPWLERQPPALNALLGELPAAPSTYYIHDIALLPGARGSGAAAQVVAALIAQARAERLASLSLVAVNGSAGFWQRHGFVAVAAPELDAKLRSYSDDAQFMIRML